MSQTGTRRSASDPILRLTKLVVEETVRLPSTVQSHGVISQEVNSDYYVAILYNWKIRRSHTLNLSVSDF